MSLRKKELSSFASAEEYDGNFDVDVFAENDIAFFVNRNKTNSYFIYAQLSENEEDSVDYTIFRKNTKGMYEEWDGGIINCIRTSCLQVSDLLGFSGINSDELKDVHPEDIEFVEVDSIQTFTAFEVSTINHS